MNDYIRKAVELADGFSFTRPGRGQQKQSLHVDYVGLYLSDEISDPILDALAAQLVRQVDVLAEFFVDSDRYGTAKVWRGRYENMSRVAKSNGENRTMNTIKVIVDSGVLSTGDS